VVAFATTPLLRAASPSRSKTPTGATVSATVRAPNYWRIANFVLIAEHMLTDRHGVHVVRCRLFGNRWDDLWRSAA